MFDSNRRKYPRANYPCQLTLWMADGGNETVLANTSNIGVGGICVNLTEYTPVGTKVDVHLTFSKSTTPFKCHGVIVRVTREDNKFYNVGIQFDPLNELKHAFLAGHVTDLIDLEKKDNS